MIPLDVVGIIFQYTGCCRWKQALLCQKMRNQYYREVGTVMRRRNVLMWTHYFGKVDEAVKQACLGELHFLYGKHGKRGKEVDDICYMLGRSSMENESNVSPWLVSYFGKTRVEREAEGIVRCLNLYPDLLRIISTANFKHLPETKIKPSMDVMLAWDTSFIPRLFLGNQMAMDMMNNRSDYVYAYDGEEEEYIRIIAKTSHAVNVLLRNRVFKYCWKMAIEILGRQAVMDELKRCYPRITNLHDIPYLHHLYRAVCDIDMIILITEIFRSAMETYRASNTRVLYRWLKTFHACNKEIAVLYFDQYMHTRDGIENWLEDNRSN